MTGMVLKRLASGLVTLLVVSVMVFVGTEILPGDVAQAILGQQATPEAVQALRAQAAEKYPTPGKGGGHQGANLRKTALANQQAEFNRLVAQHIPNHYQANQDALNHIRGEAIGNTTQALGERPPPPRGSRTRVRSRSGQNLTLTSGLFQLRLPRTPIGD